MLYSTLVFLQTVVLILRAFVNCEKRKLLGFIVSKCKIKGDDIVPHFRQPFDVIAVSAGKLHEITRLEGVNIVNHQFWRPFIEDFRTFLRQSA